MMYASPPLVLSALERRVLELEKRYAAQEELIEVLARGCMGVLSVCQDQQTQLDQLIDVCTKQQALIDGLDLHLEAHGNALESHGKVLTRVETAFDVEDDEDYIDRIMDAVCLCPSGLRLPHAPR